MRAKDTAKKATVKKTAAAKKTATRTPAEKTAAAKKTATRTPAKKTAAARKTATAKNAAVTKTTAKKTATPVRGGPSPAPPARPGDLIVVDALHVGSPPREGEVLQVIQGQLSVSYRVRWADGRQTLIAPLSGTARFVRATNSRGRSR